MSVPCPTASPFDSRIPVLAIDPGDEPSRFDYSHAFALFGEGVETPVIVIDARLMDKDWMTAEHLLVILAHETAHILSCSTNERVADERGLQLVKNAGYEAAYRLYMAEYRNRLRLGAYQDAA